MRPLNPRGQAALETALTLPLVLFILLAVLQLSLLLQARLLAQFAAQRVARAGSLAQGSCEAMTDTALALLLPSVHSFATPGESPARRLGDTFRALKGSGYRYRPEMTAGYSGSIFWLRREHPTTAEVVARAGGRQAEDLDFDDPDAAPMRLEVTLVYWYALKVPFAGAVLSRLAQAQFGLRSMSGMNPWLVTDFRGVPSRQRARLDATVARELSERSGRGEHVFPIPVAATLRMMTPARLSHFATACGGMP